MKKSISKKRLREFGILIGIGFPILVGWIFPAISGHGIRVWTLFIGLPSLIIGLTTPLLLHYPYKGWMALGHALGWINSYLILGIVFIFVLQPIAYVMRFTGYDPLKKKRNGKQTYLEIRKKLHIDLTRIF